MIGLPFTMRAGAEGVFEVLHHARNALPNLRVHVELGENQKSTEHHALEESRRDAAKPLVSLTIFLISILVIGDDRITSLVRAKEKEIIGLHATRNFTKAIILVQQVLVLVTLAQIVEHKPRVRIKDAEELMTLPLEVYEECQERRQ